MFPSESFKVQTVHILIAVTAIFAPTIQIHFVAMYYRCMIWYFSRSLWTWSLNLLPQPSIGICLMLARLNFRNGRNVSAPYWGQSTIAQISPSENVIPTLMKAQSSHLLVIIDEAWVVCASLRVFVSRSGFVPILWLNKVNIGLYRHLRTIAIRSSCILMFFCNNLSYL